MFSIPLRLDFKYGAAASLLRLAAPVLPGSVLVWGVATLRPEHYVNYTSVLHLGYPVQLVIIGLSVYIFGLLFAFAVSVVVETAGAIVAWLILRLAQKSRPKDLTPWKNFALRRVTRKLLGDLVPRYDQPYDEEEVNRWAEQINVLPEEDRKTALAKIVAEAVGRKLADVEWEKWDDVLRNWMDWAAALNQQEYITQMTTLAIVTSTSLSSLLVVYLLGLGSWALYAILVVASVFAVLLEAFCSFVITARAFDKTGSLMTATLLKQLWINLPKSSGEERSQ